MMNTNLHDIQADIQRLANQQSQIQAQTIQAHQLLQAQQIATLLSQQQQQQQFGSQHNVSSSNYRPLNASFGSSPHLNQSSSFSSRPPSRDPNQHVLNYVNDQGQYIHSYQQQQQQQQQNQYNDTDSVINHKLEKLEYPRNNIIYVKDLGQGAFTILINKSAH